MFDCAHCKQKVPVEDIILHLARHAVVKVVYKPTTTPVVDVGPCDEW